MVRALLHSVYDKPDITSVHAQYDRVLDGLADRLPKGAAHLEAAFPRPTVGTPACAGSSAT